MKIYKKIIQAIVIIVMLALGVSNDKYSVQAALKMCTLPYSTPFAIAINRRFEHIGTLNAGTLYNSVKGVSREPVSEITIYSFTSWGKTYVPVKVYVPIDYRDIFCK